MCSERTMILEPEEQVCVTHMLVIAVIERQR